MNDLKKIALNAMIEIDDVDFYEEGINKVDADILKISELSINDDILISPIKHVNLYSEDIFNNVDLKEEILSNVPNREGDYILVPRVIK